MKKVTLLDNTDMLILKTLSKNPRMNQVELGKKMDLTQPAISLRLQKLRKMGILQDVGAQVDVKSVGLKMMKVEMQVRNGDAIMEKFKGCPALVNSYMLENNGMSMILVGENTEFLNCLQMHHLKKHPDITSVSTEIVADSLRGFSTCMDGKGKLEVPPCGDGPCNQCEYYIENGGPCVGCPMTKFYKGTFWQ
jgi:DNA-binding Lrp family transcriptional regulator